MLILPEILEDEVNAMWAGLGYYRRAQQLLKGCSIHMICLQFGPLCGAERATL